jgi:ribosomal protein S18 acetylase RimI-like enzyme
MTDIREYIQLARETEAFKDIELDILKETLSSWAERPGDPCSVVELRDGKTLAGFAVYARAHNTDYTYDVRAICVDTSYRGKGVGQKLAEMIEEETISQAPQAIVRFEISRTKEEAVGAGFLLERGFSLIGHIKAFYATEDDYYIYAKHVSIHAAKAKKEEEEKKKAAEANPASSASADATAPPDTATTDTAATNPAATNPAATNPVATDPANTTPKKAGSAP